MGFLSLKPFFTEIPEAKHLEDLVISAITALGFYIEGGEFRQQYSANSRQFRVLVAETFNEDDLKILCYDLGINYQDLSGSRHDVKVIELIDFMKRQGRIKQLGEYCKSMRNEHPDWEQLDPRELENQSAGDQHSLQLLGAAIFNEVEEINRRIRNIGGIEAIEITSPLRPDMKYLFNIETKIGLNHIREETFESQETKELEGIITTLFLTTYAAMLHDHAGNKVKLHLNNKIFDQVRSHPEQHPLVIIKGHPIYRFGLDRFAELSVNSLEFVNRQR